MVRSKQVEEDRRSRSKQVERTFLEMFQDVPRSPAPHGIAPEDVFPFRSFQGGRRSGHETCFVLFRPPGSPRGVGTFWGSS